MDPEGRVGHETPTVSQKKNSPGFLCEAYQGKVPAERSGKTRGEGSNALLRISGAGCRILTPHIQLAQITLEFCSLGVLMIFREGVSVSPKHVQAPLFRLLLKLVIYPCMKKKTFISTGPSSDWGSSVHQTWILRSGTSHCFCCTECHYQIEKTQTEGREKASGDD